MAVVAKTFKIGKTTRVWSITQNARIAHRFVQIEKKLSRFQAGAIDLNGGVELERVPVLRRVGLH